MAKVQIKNISQIPFEGTHSLPNSRQTLATKNDLVTDNIDALTKGILPPGQIWDWHEHAEYDELCIVLSGEGLFVWDDQSHNYQKDDVIIIPAGNKHKIEALGDKNSEFYFVRIKV
jgi:quercetin dioxygenase-like cupin family protein